jgi:hypothetical protein
LRLISRSIILAAILFAGRVFAEGPGPSKQYLATRLCEQLLTGNEVGPRELAANPLFNEVSPGVFQIIGSENYGAEIKSLSLLVARFGGHALAIGNFGHLKGLAAVDAVYFPPVGAPLNLSIKTATEVTSTNGMNAFRKHAADAESSIERHLSREAYAQSLGLVFGADGLRAPAGVSHQQYRIKTAEALFHILGLNDAEPRASGILIDAEVEVHQRPTLIEVGGDDPEHGRKKGDKVLRIVDDRIDESAIAYPAVMNLGKMIRRMREGGPVQRFIALFPKSTLVVDRDGIKTLSE